MDSAVDPLHQLVRDRVTALQTQGHSYRTLAERGGWTSHRHLYDHATRKQRLRQAVRDEVIDALAAALDLPASKVWEAAVLSLLPEHPTPLQRVLREGQAKHRIPVAKLPLEAGISEGYLQRILNGEVIPAQPETIEGLAYAFGVPVRKVQAAADASHVYTLPAHLAARMTPEKWQEALRVVEAMVSGDDDRSPGR